MKTILIVEDEPDMLEMIKLGVASAGYVVITASNGAEGLEKAQQSIPDLIISDVLMPVMDGYKFYKELKRNKETLGIPVLILTARGNMEDSFKVVGVDEFLSKPIKNQELLAGIEKLLSQAYVPKTVRSIQKVLIIGSQKEVIEEMASQLAKENCETDLARTGSEALSKVVEFLPSILILDVLMGDMESSEMVKILRKMPQAKKIPIVLYSFYELENLHAEEGRRKVLSIDVSVENCMDCGATSYLGMFRKQNFIKDMSEYING